MAKYFLDFEFIEGFHNPMFGKRRHFIDMISVGIVCEDGREYTAISNEFNVRDANDWVKENVLVPMFYEMSLDKDKGTFEHWKKKGKINGDNTWSAFKYLQQKFGKSNAQIAKEIFAFVNDGVGNVVKAITRANCWNEQFYPREFKYMNFHNTFIPKKTFGSGTDGKGVERNAEIIYNQPEFYGYYADYDWVVFGTMIDLPKGFPMYCHDLKQTLDEKLSTVSNSDFFTKFHVEKEMTLNEKLVEIKKHRLYPQQLHEHNALDDAKWNFELYKFLKTL